MSLIIDEVSSFDAFEKLKTGWEELLEHEGYSPFLSYEWFKCVVQGYRYDKDIKILVVTEGTEIVGIAPLWRYVGTQRGIHLKKIGFILCPDSPFADFVIKGSVREKVLEEIIQFLYSSTDWDILSLIKWSTESLNYLALQSIIQEQRIKLFYGYTTMTPYILIQGDWNAFLKGKSAKFRKTRRNIVNRINRMKNVEVQCIRQDTDGEKIRDVYSISEKSWKVKDEIAITSREDSRQFFEVLTKLAGKRNWLLIWILRIDGVPVAMEYDLEYGDKVYALRSDYNGNYREYSPGAYLEYYIIQHLFKEGYQEYNTGPGLNTYKMHLTKSVKKNVALNICNNNSNGWLLWALEGRCFPFLRKIRDMKNSLKDNIKNYGNL